MKNKMKKGISLITLIITIIVIVILAAAIILNLNSTNMISNAKKAKLENDFSVLKDELTLYHADQFLKDEYAGFGKYNSILLDAGYGSGSGISTEKGIEYNGEEKSGTIYDILTNLNKTDFDKRVVISDGEIVFVDENDPYNPENFDKVTNGGQDSSSESDTNKVTVTGELKVMAKKVPSSNFVNIQVSYPYKTLEEITSLTTEEKNAKFIEVENKNRGTSSKTIEEALTTKGYNSLQEMIDDYWYNTYDEFLYEEDYFVEYNGSGYAYVILTGTEKTEYMSYYDDYVEFKVKENGTYIFECVDENDSNLRSTVTVVVDELIDPTVFTDEAKDSNVNEVYSYKYPKLPDGFEYVNNGLSNWERTVENNTYIRVNYDDGLLIRNKTTNDIYVWVPVKPEQYEEYFVNYYDANYGSEYSDDMEDTEKAEYIKIKDSVYTYGGFYVASNIKDTIEVGYDADGADIWSQGLATSRAAVTNNDTVASTSMYIPQLEALTDFLTTGRYGDTKYSEYTGFYSEEEAYECASKNINSIYTPGATLLSDVCSDYNGEKGYCCFGGIDVVSGNYTSERLDYPYSGPFDDGYNNYPHVSIRPVLYLK